MTTKAKATKKTPVDSDESVAVEPAPEPTPSSPPEPEPYRENVDAHGRPLSDGVSVAFYRPGSSKRERGVVANAHYTRGVVLVKLESLPEGDAVGKLSVPGIVDYSQSPTPIATSHLHRE